MVDLASNNKWDLADGLDTRHCSTSNIFHFLWKITGLVFCFKVLFLDLAHCVIVCLPRNKHDYRGDFTGRDLQRWRRLTSRRQLGIRSIPLIMMLMLIMMMVMIMAILIMLTFICIITYIINLKTILLLSTDTNRFYWFPKFFNLSVYSVVTSYRDTKWITEGPFISGLFCWSLWIPLFPLPPSKSALWWHQWGMLSSSPSYQGPQVLWIQPWK